jgi:hypothetical protein
MCAILQIREFGRLLANISEQAAVLVISWPTPKHFPRVICIPWPIIFIQWSSCLDFTVMQVSKHAKDVQELLWARTSGGRELQIMCCRPFEIRPWLQFGRGRPQMLPEYMHHALNALAGQTLFFSMCEWQNHSATHMMAGYSYREFSMLVTTDGIDSDWETITDRLDLNDKWHAYAGPEGWNEPDLLELSIQIHASNECPERSGGGKNMVLWSWWCCSIERTRLRISKPHGRILNCLVMHAVLDPWKRKPVGGECCEWAMCQQW